MIQRILKKDLNLKPWKPMNVQLLLGWPQKSGSLYSSSEILVQYRNSDAYSKLFFYDNCAIYSFGSSHNIVCQE